MADEITIKVRAEVDKAIAGLNKIQLEQKETKQGSKSLADSIKKNWVGIGAAVVGAGAVIVKAFSFTKEFALFKQASQAMSKQFGVSADSVIKKLREVSAGTISNKNLVLSANKAMALGVTKDVGKMAKLLEFARIRARAMGTDTTEAFNDIVIGIGRGSPLILDNLGIITKGWAEEAKAAGVAYDAQFILNKVLAQSKEASEKAGGGALTLSEQFGRASATAQNLKVTIGGALAPVFKVLLGVFSDAASVFRALPSSIRTITSVLGLLVPALIAVNVALGPVGAAIALLVGLSVAALTKLSAVIVKSNELSKKRKEHAASELGQQEAIIEVETRKARRAKIAIKNLENELLKTKLKNKADVDAAGLLGGRIARETALAKALAPQVDVENRITKATEKLNAALEEKQKAVDAISAIEKKRKEDADAEKAAEAAAKAVAAAIEAEKKLTAALSEEAKKRALIRQQEIERAISMIDHYANSAVSVIGSISQVQQDRSAKQVSNIEEERDKSISALKTELDASNTSAARKIELQKMIVAEETKAQAKITAEKKKAHDKEKKAGIAQIWINAAIAVMKGFAQLGPIGGIVAAAATVVAAAAQTAVVTSKGANPYATGGIAGLNGPETILVGDGAGAKGRTRETVLPSNLTEMLMAASDVFGGNAQTINKTESTVTNNNNIQVAANDPIEFVNEMKRQYGMEVFQ